MKNKDFKDLLTSLEQAKRIHVGKLKTAQAYKLNSVKAVGKREKKGI